MILQSVRSFLYVPADHLHMIEKATTSAADAVIFDLEDAVAIPQKRMARETLAGASAWGQRDKLLLIRVNDVQTPYFAEDMRLAVSLCPDAVILPKADENAITIAQNLLSVLEAESGKPDANIPLIPLIETAYGVCRAYEIAAMSRRICAMQFGAEDFTRDMEIPRTKSGEEFLQARRLMAMACKACGIGAIDTPFPDFRDAAGLEQDCLVAKHAGMTAKTCIHPAQLEMVNRLFFPSEEEIGQAQRILDLALLPENQARGAFQLDGKMIDAPILERARKTLQKAGR